MQKVKQKDTARGTLYILVISIILVISGIGVFFGYGGHQQYQIPIPTPTLSPSPTPYPMAFNTLTPVPTSTTMPGWKLYTNHREGYTFDAPQEWYIQVTSNIRDLDYLNHSGDITLDSNKPGTVDFDGPLHGFMTIYLPDKPIKNTHGKQTANLQEYESFSPYGSSSIQHHTYITVDGHRTLVVKATSSVNPPPPPFRGSYCSECSTAYVYIDAGDNNILRIMGYWGKERTDFETLFDKVVATIQFQR